MEYLHSDIQLYNIPSSNEGVEYSSKDLLIVLEENEFKSHKELLFKILGAMGKDIENDVSFVKISEGSSMNISAINENKKSNIISFGLSPDRLGINASFRANHLYPTESYSILLTHSLSKLEVDKVKKKALWTALQQYFTT